MGRKNYSFLFIIILAVLSIFICIKNPFELGLDLRGGSQLTLEVQPTEEITKITSNDKIGREKTHLNQSMLMSYCNLERSFKYTFSKFLKM